MIKIDRFEGVVPRVEDRLLRDTQAQVAVDVDVRSGALRPILETKSEKAIAPNQQSVFFPFNDDFLTFATDVDFQRSPIAALFFDRLYHTGDGVPKVRFIDSGGIEQVRDLGVPGPVAAPTVVAQAKGAATFRREWGFFYEESDGRQLDKGTMVEGTQVIVTEPDKSFTINNVSTNFPKVDASVDAVFIVFFDAFDNNVSLLGRVYGSISTYRRLNDLLVNGAGVTANQENTGDTTTVDLVYDTSRAADYRVERSYVYTFVSELGEESQPSPPSTTLGVDPTEDALVSVPETTVPSNTVLAFKRIYRTVTTVAGTEFQFVTEIDINATSFLDSVTDDLTGEVLPSQDWEPPPAGLAGLVSLAGGFFAGFVGNTLYRSVANHPHAWPSEFTDVVDYQIVGLGAVENSIVICTDGFPYLSIGVDPENQSLQRLLARQACVSKRSIVNAGMGIAYASPDGLVFVSGGNIDIISRVYFTEKEWSELLPRTMIGAYHDQRIFMFAQSQTVIFDNRPERPNVVFTNERAAGVHSDIESDELYMIQGSEVRSWEQGADRKDMTWKSRHFVFPKIKDFVAARVLAEAYPITFNLYSSRQLVHTRTVASSDMFTLPTMRPERDWEFEVVGSENVTEVLLTEDRYAKY